MILHLALLALAAFCFWEAARPLLPYNLPDPVVAALLLAVAALLDTFVPERELGLLAVVALVGILHQKFGATGSGSYALRLPRRKPSKIGLP